MNTNDITKLAIDLISKHGLHDWRFEYDRAKRRAGLCHYGKKVISLSSYYVEKNIDKLDEITDTILHEIAHAIAGYKAGHNYLWKIVCERIGANPTRCYDSEVVEMPKGNWKAKCPVCEKEFHMHRRPKYNGLRYCVACGPDKGKLFYLKNSH